MLNVLETTKVVVDNSKDVKISTESISKLGEMVRMEDLKVSELELFSYDWNFEESIYLIFVFNAINFCYWAKKGEDKWTVEIRGKKMDGSIALFRCLEEEYERNSEISTERLDVVLKGKTTIPLFDERVTCLKEMQKVDLIKIFNEAENDALKLVDLMISNFPRFDDVAELNNSKIAFYKRAQLNSKMVSDLLVAKGKGEMRNLNKLTAFADYKIPQILRRFGILEYTLELANKIDNFELIEANSREEIEIRANTIWAVELIKQELRKKFDFVTASHVDSMLWSMSQTKTEGEKPYHRTLTIAY